MFRGNFAFALALFVGLGSLRADPGQVHLVYKVGVVVDPAQEYHFSIEVTNPGTEDLVFVIPHWAPGAYRELRTGRTPSWTLLDHFAAKNEKGEELTVTPDGERRWRVHNRGSASKTITFSYVNTNPGRPNNNRSYLGEKSGLIDGPRNWMYLEGMKGLPVHVHFDLPDGWKIGTGLDPTFDGKVFTARDYDRLIDCPTLVGSMNSWTFVVRGVPHRVCVDTGAREAKFDKDKFSDMVQRIVETYVDMFDDVPYEHYTFIYTPGGGGLEHLSSTTIGGSRSMRARFLQSVTAHEFFHTWNVKRLRPQRLGPFDYTSPQPVNDLWICEGLTSYYTSLGLWRAGLTNDAQYLGSVAGSIRSWENNNAHFWQSPEDSSRGVWINNSRVSYYLQGQILGLMIDLAIREGSEGKHSLDDVMRHMYSKYGGYYRHHPSKPGFNSEDWLPAIKSVTGVDLGKFWKAHIQGSEEVDWNRYLAVAGWQVELGEQPISALSGLSLKDGPDGGAIAGVPDGSPLKLMGMEDGDIIMEFNGRPVRSRRRLSRSLQRAAGASEFSMKVERSGETKTLEGKIPTGTDLMLLQARRHEEGRVMVWGVPASSSWSEMGAERGDIIQQIGGAKPSSVGEVIAALSSAKPGSELEVTIARGAQQMTKRLKAKRASKRKVGKAKSIEEPSATQLAHRKALKAGHPRVQDHSEK